MTYLKLLSAAVAAVVVLGSSGCGDGGGDGDGRGQGGPPDVTTITVHAQDVPVIEQLPGRTSAFRIAEVRPRVDGIVVERHFSEGSDVKAGDHLYQLDDTEYKVAMQRAEANRTQAIAARHAARLKVDRYKPLVGTRAISQEDYDDALIALEQASAAVQVAEASVAAAKLDLEYTQVRAPISGRVGKSMVTEGALVTANQPQALTVITQLDPIYVDIRRPSTDGHRIRQVRQTVDVTLLPSPATAGYSGTGKLQFSDVLVDESTGAVLLRALFPNPQHRLLPGLFVTARLDLGAERGILVTQKAVTRDESGAAQVWRVDGDHVVHHVTVTTGRAVENQWLVTDGLSEGDVVVTEGMQRLSPEIEVVPHSAEQPLQAAQGG